MSYISQFRPLQYSHVGLRPLMVSLVIVSCVACGGDSDDLDPPVDPPPPTAVFQLVSEAIGFASEGGSFSPSVSNDGRWVAFVSDANNLVADDSNEVADVFLRDVESGTTTRVNVAADGSEADGASQSAVIAADGSVIAFHSLAMNLVEGEITTAGEIYRVSRMDLSSIQNISTPCAGCRNEISNRLAISTDGNTVAFETRRRFVADDDDTEYDVYVWDASTPALALETTDSNDENSRTFWGSNNFDASLSADGRFLGFHSAALGFYTPDITVQNFHPYIKDRRDRGVERVSNMDGTTDPCEGVSRATGTSGPRISANGRVAAFHSNCIFGLETGTDTNGTTDVFVRDIDAQTTTRVSVASNGTQANGPSRVIGISDDGNRVLFVSDASNLIVGDRNDAPDLFVHDRAEATTRRVSVGPDMEEIPEGAITGAMSRNGAFLVFVTTTELVASDTQPGQDVYLRSLE